MAGNHSKLRTPNWWRNKLGNEKLNSNGDAGRFKKSFDRIECDRWEEGMTHSELVDVYEEHWHEYMNSVGGDPTVIAEMSELLEHEAEEERLSSILSRQPWISIDELFKEHQLPLDELQRYLKLKKQQQKKEEHQAGEQQLNNQKLEKFNKLISGKSDELNDLG